MQIADPRIVEIKPMNRERWRGGWIGSKSENGLFSRGLEMSIRWKVAVHHGKAGFPRILVQRAADKQDRGLHVGRMEVLGKKIQKLWQPNRFLEFEMNVSRRGVFLGEKLFQLSNCRGELVRPGFRTMKYACVRQSDLCNRFQLEGVINHQ